MKLKRLFTTLIAALLLVSLCGCNWYPGTDEDRALFSEAITSLLAVSGERFDPIYIIDRDSCGKTLFTFSGLSAHYNSEVNAVFALMIAQGYDGESVCYYEDCNYICVGVKGRRHVETYDGLLEYFSEEEINALKLENDWDKPADEAKTVKETVVRRKHNPIGEETLRKAFGQTEISYSYAATVPLCCDSNYNFLYYVGTDGEDGRKEYLVMFDIYGKIIEGTGIEELTDFWSREQLKEFKAANGWQR